MLKVELILFSTPNVPPSAPSFPSWVNGTTFLCRSGTEPVFCLLFSLVVHGPCWVLLSPPPKELSMIPFPPSPLTFLWFKGWWLVFSGPAAVDFDYFRHASQLENHSEISLCLDTIMTLKYWNIMDGLSAFELLYTCPWFSGDEESLTRKVCRGNWDTESWTNSEKAAGNLWWRFGSP